MLQPIAILHICIIVAAASDCESVYDFHDNSECEELSSPAECEAASQEQYCWWMGKNCVGETETMEFCGVGDEQTCTSLMPPVPADVTLAKTTSICIWTGVTPLCQPEISNDMFRKKCYPHTDEDACINEGVDAFSDGVCDWVGGDEDSEDIEVISDIPCASECAKELEFCAKRWTIDYSVLENMSDMDKQIMYRCFHNREKSEACEICSSEHFPTEEETRDAQKKKHNVEIRKRRNEIRKRHEQRRQTRTALIVALSIAICLLLIVLWAIRLEGNALRKTDKASLVNYVDAHRYNTTSVDVEEIDGDLPVVQRA